MQPLFNTALSLARKRRALALGVPGADFLAAHAGRELEERLGAVERRFAHAAALFCITPHGAEAIRASGRAADVTRIEADAAFLGRDAGQVVVPETVPLEPEGLDLAVSLLALHEANDIPGVLAQIRRSLKPDGLFLAAFPGAGTLAELRESLLAAETELSGGAGPRVMPFTDVRDAGALLQRAGFALPVADVESLTVRYDHLFALIGDLRAMGATNTLLARPRRTPPRALFTRAARIYAERFSDPDGRIRATFSLIWLSGWAPHASQQKPLKPGSAKLSLADFLDKSAD